jgi:hypothetical protein
MYLVIKTLITALLVVGISEAGKRFTSLGALLASLPLTSILAFVWLYKDTKDSQKVAALSWEILAMVIPSLMFFIALPLLLRLMKFVPAMLLAAAITAGMYFLWMLVLKKLNILP